MKKSLLALAVLGAFAGTASAQSSVTLYGIVDMGYSYIDTKRDGVSSLSSLDAGLQSGNRLGFRGREDLGRGLGAIFQLEAGFNLDTGQSAQGSTAVPTRIFGRIAYVGLDSSFGQLVLGRFGTFGSGTGPFDMFSEIDPFGTGFNGAGLQSTFTEANSLRVDNTILFRTQVLGGFQAGALYSFNVDGSESTAGSSTNNRAFSGGVNWRGGPIYVALTYAQIKFNDTLGFEDQKMLQVGGTWDFKIAKIHAAYAKEDNVRATAPVTSPFSGTAIPALNGSDGDAWMVGVTVPLGAFTFLGSYQNRDGDANGPFKAEGSVWGLGALYSLSKRTNLYAVYGDFSGDSSLNEGQANPVGATPTPTSFAASDAANRSRFMLGMRHYF